MIKLAQINSTFSCIYLTSQLLDIVLWTLVVLVLIKRLGNNQYNYLYLKWGDILMLLAGIVAIVQFSNQFYYYSIFLKDSMLNRKWIWMIFQKLVTCSILTTYWRDRPKIFTLIKEELRIIFYGY